LDHLSFLLYDMYMYDFFVVQYEYLCSVGFVSNVVVSSAVIIIVLQTPALLEEQLSHPKYQVVHFRHRPHLDTPSHPK